MQFAGKCLKIEFLVENRRTPCAEAFRKVCRNSLNGFWISYNIKKQQTWIKNKFYSLMLCHQDIYILLGNFKWRSSFFWPNVHFLWHRKIKFLTVSDLTLHNSVMLKFLFGPINLFDEFGLFSIGFRLGQLLYFRRSAKLIPFRMKWEHTQKQKNRTNQVKSNKIENKTNKKDQMKRWKMFPVFCEMKKQYHSE